MGIADGLAVGKAVGHDVGTLDGRPLGSPVGFRLGAPDGCPVGVKQYGYDVIPLLPLTSIGAINDVSLQSSTGTAPDSLLLAK